MSSDSSSSVLFFAPLTVTADSVAAPPNFAPIAADTESQCALWSRRLHQVLSSHGGLSLDQRVQVG